MWSLFVFITDDNHLAQVLVRPFSPSDSSCYSPLRAYTFSYSLNLFFLFSISFSRFCFVVNYSSRGSRVRQLRRDVDASVAAGRNRSLFVQRLWSLLQDERAKPSAHQAQAQTGKCKSRNFLFNSSFHSRFSLLFTIFCFYFDWL